MKADFDVYTDGACKGNPGKGAWAAIVLKHGTNEVLRELSGTSDRTTNNIMELTAVAEGLKTLVEPAHVVVYSDSAYIVNAFRDGWIRTWQRNGWKTKDKAPVKNRELWEEIVRLTTLHRVQFEKVKGHSGDRFNERVDELANLALQ